MNRLLIDVKQLSESTGLSVFTLYSWINQKRIPYVKVERLVRCMEKYKRGRQAQVSNATVNREVACLKYIFTKAIEWGIVKKNPGKKVKFLRERNTRLRYLDEKKIGRLHDACAEHLKPIVIVALNTGMRKEEILSLQWKDLDFRSRIITILDTKNGESRELLGHKSFEMTLRYAHLSPEHKKAALDILGKKMSESGHKTA